MQDQVSMYGHHLHQQHLHYFQRLKIHQVAIQKCRGSNIFQKRVQVQGLVLEI